MTEKKSFWEWYNETEKTAGSLMTPAHAAKMIETSRQYIEKLAINGRIKKYYYEDMPFIGMNDINEEMAKRKNKPQKSIDNGILKAFAEVMQLLDNEAEKAVRDALNIPEGISVEDNPEKIREAIRIHRKKQHKV